MSIMEELVASDPDVKLDVKQNEPPTGDPPAGDPPSGDPPADPPAGERHLNRKVGLKKNLTLTSRMRKISSKDLVL